eukprot:CAMPEP_0118651702 /NCGR_PEP_ID=MMETSP0785-20121206/10923_1 /TAXON_ID=91992 /ORGANISM="Bolidomonas pacifica, Strain CCMP 1866" /LENGTH=402 /DNA_ID=CAMNT_0006544165 /DNA_START=53 /DNA_END=1258 /DNA_ORIENTATION=-
MSAHHIRRRVYEQKCEAAVDAARTRWYALSPNSDQPERDLALFYQNDRKLQSLEIDASQRTAALRSCAAHALLLPCFWPHMIIMGIPCSTLCCMAERHKTAASSHRLTLRERTLYLEVDSYVPAQYIPVPCCVSLCNLTMISSHTVTIRLVDISDITLEQPPPNSCNTAVGVPVLNVWVGERNQSSFGGMMTMGGLGNKPHIAIDSPMNFEDFKGSVMAQREKVLSGYVSDNPPESIIKASKDAQGSGNAFATLFRSAMAATATASGPPAYVSSGVHFGATSSSAFSNNMHHKVHQQFQFASAGPSAPPSAPFSMKRDVPEPELEFSIPVTTAYPVTSTTSPSPPPPSYAAASSDSVVTTEDVVRVLSKLGLTEYTATFQKECIDGALFKMLDENALIELGV